MRKVRKFIFELTDGMVVSDDIATSTGQLILPKGYILDSAGIDKLSTYGIMDLFVDEEDEAPKRLSPSPETTYSERIKSTPEFHEFKELYLDNVEDLSSNINDIVQKNQPINTEELLSTTASLLKNARGSIHLFDMLHNMREFDDSTFTHCINVSLISAVLGGWLGLPKEDIDVLSLCGLLHDIGKLTTPESILTKPGKLTPEEYSIMKDHVKGGYEHLRNQQIDNRIKEACLLHHERCDGTGYPFGLKGNKIPDFAKIVSIADVYDAMTAKRVYRGPLCPFTVIKMFEDEGLYRYDPRFILTFLENVVATYINNTVLLSDGREGEVVLINQLTLSKPIVRCGGTFVDLSKTDLTITAIL